MLRAADAVVVRGSYHREHLESRGIRVAAVIQDGVDTRLFLPRPVPKLRAALGVDGAFCVGVLGSINWPRGSVGPPAWRSSKRSPACPTASGHWGWERARACRRCVVPPNAWGLPTGFGSSRGGPSSSSSPITSTAWTCASRRRPTTSSVASAPPASFRCFLACGRYVLASRVGEAARVLRGEMLVDYRGHFGPAHPSRLAERVGRLAQGADLLAWERTSRAIAEREFDYDVLASRLGVVLQSAAAGGRGNHPADVWRAADWRSGL